MNELYLNELYLHRDLNLMAVFDAQFVADNKHTAYARKSINYEL